MNETTIAEHVHVYRHLNQSINTQYILLFNIRYERVKNKC